MGEIGIDRKEALYELKQWEILSIISGYRKREITTLKTVRWQTWCILCAMGAKNINTPEELLELPGDGEDGRGEISDDEYNECLRLIKETNNC